MKYFKTNYLVSGMAVRAKLLANMPISELRRIAGECTGNADSALIKGLNRGALLQMVLLENFEDAEVVTQ